MNRFYKESLCLGMLVFGFLSTNAQHIDETQYQYRNNRNESNLKIDMVENKEVPDSLLLFRFVDYGDISNADVKLEEGDFAKNLKKANNGDPESQRIVAQCYITGFEVEQSFGEGWKWLAKAVDSGCSRAEYNIATFYRDGFGVPQSYEESSYWFRKAASNGDSDSMVEIGKQFEFGRGVDQDNRIAAEYYWRAAERGNKEGAYRYAMMLRDGKGVAKDLNKSNLWFKKSGDFVEGDK